MKMLNLIDESTFNNILTTIGLNEEGMIKAKKIKQDIKENKPLDMTEIMTFVSDYKQQISKSDNPMIGQFLNMFGITEEPVSQHGDATASTESPTPPTVAPAFDLNQMMNMISPLLSGLQGNRQQKRSTKYKRR